MRIASLCHGNTASYQQKAGYYYNFGWLVQPGRYDSSVQLPWIALVLGLGPEAGDALPLAVG
jgi:hypothetical protein